LAQVDYVGSSGYGKEYRNLFNLQWDASDVADAVSCVEGVAKEGLIGPKRLGITRHSADVCDKTGVVKFPDIWAASIAESGVQVYKLCSANS
jgi:hypothetical protein